MGRCRLACRAPRVGLEGIGSSQNSSCHQPGIPFRRSVFVCLRSNTKACKCPGDRGTCGDRVIAEAQLPASHARWCGRWHAGPFQAASSRSRQRQSVSARVPLPTLFRLPQRGAAGSSRLRPAHWPTRVPSQSWQHGAGPAQEFGPAQLQRWLLDGSISSIQPAGRVAYQVEVTSWRRGALVLPASCTAADLCRPGGQCWLGWR
mmetsp:Transcript_15683/g.37813  ORF Transcript_15683/g.37813 Transcript_15683/m.37813 type:complete len:204 (+) Transcript_15683:2216-2827(+)